MSRGEGPAKIIREKSIASCAECDVDLNLDDDMVLIMATEHNKATGHQVAVWSQRTEVLKGKR